MANCEKKDGWAGRGDVSFNAMATGNPLSRLSIYTTTPIAYGDYFYVCADNGVFSAYDAMTGQPIYQARLPSSFSASPVACDGKLFMSSEDGDVYVVKAGTKFERLAVNPTLLHDTPHREAAAVNRPVGGEDAIEVINFVLQQF